MLYVLLILLTSLYHNKTQSAHIITHGSFKKISQTAHNTPPEIKVSEVQLMQKQKNVKIEKLEESFKIENPYVVIMTPSAKELEAYKTFIESSAQKQSNSKTTTISLTPPAIPKRNSYTFKEDPIYEEIKYSQIVLTKKSPPSINMETHPVLLRQKSQESLKQADVSTSFNSRETKLKTIEENIEKIEKKLKKKKKKQNLPLLNEKENSAFLKTLQKFFLLNKPNVNTFRYNNFHRF